MLIAPNTACAAEREREGERGHLYGKCSHAVGLVTLTGSLQHRNIWIGAKEEERIRRKEIGTGNNRGVVDH